MFTEMESAIMNKASKLAYRASVAFLLFSLVSKVYFDHQADKIEHRIVEVNKNPDDLRDKFMNEMTAGLKDIYGGQREFDYTLFDLESDTVGVATDKRDKNFSAPFLKQNFNIYVADKVSSLTNDQELEKRAGWVITLCCICASLIMYSFGRKFNKILPSLKND
jgi:hypothetical protein